MSSSANGRDGDLREVLRHDRRADGTCGSGQAARHRSHQRHPVTRPGRVRTEATRPPTTSTSAPGIRGQREPEPEDDGQRDPPDHQRRPAEVAEATDPRRELLPRVHAIGGRPGELGQLADHDVDRGAGQEPGHDRPRQESGQSSRAGRSRPAGTGPRSRARSPRPAAPPRCRPTPVSRTAPPRRPRATSSGRSRCGATCRSSP